MFELLQQKTKTWEGKNMRIKDLAAKLVAVIEANKKKATVEKVNNLLIDWKEQTSDELDAELLKEHELKRVIVHSFEFDCEDFYYYLVRGKKSLFSISVEDYDDGKFTKAEKVSIDEDMDLEAYVLLIEKAMESYEEALEDAISDIESN